MAAPVNLFWGMGEGPAKFTLTSMNSPYWFAAKCRRKECPLSGSPFECPFQKPCTDVREEDWDKVSTYEVEEEDHGDNS